MIDSHAHIFPFLGGSSGFPSAEDHMATIQWGTRLGAARGTVRARAGGGRVDRQTVVREPALGRSSLVDVGFTAGRFGRFEWESEGESLYVQGFPPLLADMEMPVELLIAMMDHAGVERAVLQNDAVYGRLNEEFAAAVARWPDRLLSLASVDLVSGANHAETIGECVRVEGHRGLFVRTDDYFEGDFSTTPFDRRFSTFWERVSELGIPVYWQLLGFPDGGEAAYLRTWQLFGDWLEQNDSIPTVLVGGLPFSMLRERRVPDRIRDVIVRHSVKLEVLFPIQIGGEYEYPFPESTAPLRYLYDEFGVDALLWGSDVPNIERYCTYRQSWKYLEYVDFLSDEDREQMWGRNAAKLFGVGTQGSHATSSSEEG